MLNPATRNCRICQWIRGEAKPVYDFLYQVRDYPKWYVNQYGAEEGFLGWLTLQPENCEEQLSELTDSKTLEQLGTVIQKIESAMFHQWPKMFPEDRLERVHTASFMESLYDVPDVKPDPEYYYHVHIHIIPRSVMTGKLIRRHVNGVRQYVAWEDPTVAGRMKCLSRFDDYLPRDSNVASFFSFLTGEVGLIRIDPHSSRGS